MADRTWRAERELREREAHIERLRARLGSLRGDAREQALAAIAEHERVLVASVEEDLYG